MSNKPCLKCERRHIGCHAECEDYAAAKAAIEKEREARHQQMSGWEAGEVLAAGRARQGKRLQRKYGGINQ